MRDFLTFNRFFWQMFWLSKGVMLALLLLVLLSSFSIYHFEEIDYWDALYMSLITALTIGYGDLTPYTAMGKITSIFVGFVGLVFVGLTVAIATIALRLTAERHVKKK